MNLSGHRLQVALLTSIKWKMIAHCFMFVGYI